MLEKYLEIAGVIVGLVYIFLEYRASVWLWLAGVIMPAIYIYVYYAAGLYADVGVNIYYLIAGLYGWIMWQWGVRKGHRAEELGKSVDSSEQPTMLVITRTPKRFYIPLTTVCLLFFAVIAGILIKFTDSTVPYGDSITTAMSIVALWMLAHKYVEHWLIWIVVDVICCGLYFYKGLNYTALLYGLYAIIALFGYFKWLKMMKKEEDKKTKILPLPKIGERIEMVILADGDYPNSENTQHILNSAIKVVCCDAAAIKFMEQGGVPYAIVGDCDSLSENFKSRYRDIIHCEQEQESNDLTKAVRFCILNGISHITILGATGKRDDHSIANVGLLAEYIKLKEVQSVRMVSDSGLMEPILGDTIFESFPGQQVSIFCLSPMTKITTVDLKYPLYGAQLDGWWQGSLNEAVGDKFGVLTDGPTIVYRLLQ